MSKIPQGEWSAIAARYAQGESISRIAQSYGCTPPAIHYILKRNKQRTGQKSEQPLNGRPASPATAISETAQASATATFSGASEPRREGGTTLRPFGRDLGTHPVPGGEPSRGTDRGPAPAAMGQGQEREGSLTTGSFGNARKSVRGSALAAGLDSELHGRAEAAIEAFRASFDAALAEGSPGVRQRLRQAASDLMRVAARTTIVLDKISAGVERGSTSVQNGSRFTNPRDHF